LWLEDKEEECIEYEFNKIEEFCFLDRAFSIMKTKINQQNAQINSGLIYYDQSLQHVSAPQSKPSSGISKSLRVTKPLY